MYSKENDPENITKLFYHVSIAVVKSEPDLGGSGGWDWGKAEWQVRPCIGAPPPPHRHPYIFGKVVVVYTTVVLKKAMITERLLLSINQPLPRNKMF